MNNYTEEQKMRLRCEAFLHAMLGKDHVSSWWQSRNLAFNSITPEQMWSISPEKVYHYLVGHVDKYG